ncbi:MAG TPA: hypothetical protein VFT06_15115, partial [Flavisolibacter sp.]|nr:hypothetical protein [Flavisolibacter sp.]
MNRMFMREISLLLFTLIISLGTKAQKNIDGTWQGKLAVSSASLLIVVHIKSDAGNHSATLDSPDQGAKGIPVSQVRLAGDSLLLEIAAAGAKLAGIMTSDSTFSGQWIQGVCLPLALKKLGAGEAIAEVKHPQTPMPPFPYV